MFTDELIGNFYGILNAGTDTAVRYREFTMQLASKVHGHIHSGDASVERKLLENEYASWGLFTQLFNVQVYHNQWVDENRYPALGYQLYQEIVSDRLFLSWVCLMHWTESLRLSAISREKDVNFMNTLNDCKKRAGSLTRLDPDAVFTEKVLYNSRDLELERQVIQQAFYMVRRGDIASAQALFVDSKQYWRSVSISGLLPYFDLNQYEFPSELNFPSVMQTAEYHSVDDSIYKSEIGNLNIDSYISACWVLSCQDRPDGNDNRYEKALYGSLCGNYNAMISVCNSDLYDHLWSMLRVQFVFGLRKILKRITDKCQPFESLNDIVNEELGVPLEIPKEWPKSVGGILRTLQQQQQHREKVSSPYVKLQLAAICGAVDNKWDDVYNSLIAFYEETQSENESEKLYSARFAVHLSILLKSSVKLNHENLVYHQRMVRDYIRILISRKSHIGVLEYYLKYLTILDILVELIWEIYLKYSLNDFRTCLERIVNLVPDHQAVLCQIVMKKLDGRRIAVNLGNSLDIIRAANTTDDIQNIYELLSLISSNTRPTCYNELLELIRTLIITGKFSLTEYLVFQCDITEVPELFYWREFLFGYKAYSNFHELKKKGILPEATEDLIDPRVILAPRNLENNSFLLTEGHFEKLRGASTEAIEKLTAVLGIRTRALPLDEVASETVQYFNREIVWVCFGWLIDVYEEVGAYSDLQQLYSGLRDYSKYIKEEQYCEILRKIEGVTQQLSKLHS